jgi:hypothetical protein
MGWGDVRYCFAMAVLVILIILLLSFFLSFFLPPKVYPTHFSENTERKSMKLHSVDVKTTFGIFKMAAVAMENDQNAKKLKEKQKNNHSRLLAEQKLMKLNRNNIHI